MKIYCESCKGTGEIEEDYGLWGQVCQCDSCGGKGYTEVDQSIRTEYVEMPYGEQLKFADDNPTIKFAVPPSEENVNDGVNVVDEIRDEILSIINGLANDWYIEFKAIPHHKINQLVREVEKIFKKY